VRLGYPQQNDGKFVVSALRLAAIAYNGRQIRRAGFNLETRMNRAMILKRLSFSGAMISLVSCLAVSAAAQQKPRSKVIELDAHGEDHLQLLAGPPESVTMKSGLVVLVPGASVGKHTTGQHEEMLVILEGQGKMDFRDGSSLDVKANHALYCPPQTEHNVTNTGHGVLRYVYVVASTK
jgi:mannose-6-phosphate isomerase-like protein (cupin superfamily)